jgi:hypothetical protein
VSASDSLGNTTSSTPTTITVVAKAAVKKETTTKNTAPTRKKAAKKPAATGSIRAPGTLRLKTLRKLGWRVQAAVTLSAGANVTVRLDAAAKTIARATHNVPSGRTPISILIPKRSRRRGTFTMVLRIAGSTKTSSATFRVR